MCCHWQTRLAYWHFKMDMFLIIAILALCGNCEAFTGFVKTTSLDKPLKARILSTGHAVTAKTRLYMGEEGEKFSKDNDDFITKLFGWAMPKPEDVGLNRYTKDSLPENYPAVKDQWAEPLASDKTESMQLVRQVLARTNLEARELKLAYSGNRDGWTAKKFHAKLDAQGPCVVLCKTTEGDVFGGYNPCGHVGLGEARGSIAAFLFVFKNRNTAERPIKLRKIAGAGMAQMDYETSGPRFGPEGLTIPLEGPLTSAKLVRTKLGLYYERMPDGGNSLFLGKQMQGELTDLEVFTGVWDEGERIPYSGAMFFQVN